MAKTHIPAAMPFSLKFIPPALGSLAGVDAPAAVSVVVIPAAEDAIIVVEWLVVVSLGIVVDLVVDGECAELVLVTGDGVKQEEATTKWG